MLLWLLSYRQGLWTLCPGIHRYKDYNYICIPTRPFSDTVVQHTIDLFEDNVLNEPHPWTFTAYYWSSPTYIWIRVFVLFVLSVVLADFYSPRPLGRLPYTCSRWLKTWVASSHLLFCSVSFFFTFPFFVSTILFGFLDCLYFIMDLHCSQLSNYQLFCWRIVRSFSIQKNSMQQLNYIFLCTRQRSKATG